MSASTASTGPRRRTHLAAPAAVGSRRPHRTDRGPAAVPWTTIVVVVLLAGTTAVLFGLGFRTFVVRTPSMGTAAPVGTLIVTTTTTVADLRVGDVITFRPPERPGTTFTHRVVSVDGDAVHTRGDASPSADPWTVTGADLVGRAVVVAPGVGWLLRAVPYLLTGSVVTYLLTGPIAHRTARSGWRVLGTVGVFMATCAVLRPFTAAMVVGTGTGSRPGSGGTATVVSTGMLPVQLVAADGSRIALASGEVGQLELPARLGTPEAWIHLALHLPPWGWVVFGLVCAMPLLWCLVVGLEPRPHGRGNAGSGAARS